MRKRIAESAPATANDIDPDEIRVELESYFLDVRALLGGSIEQGRDALRALLGDGRLMVGVDAERGFRVTGTVWLDPRRNSLVAGAGFQHLSPIWPLPWRLAA